MEFQPTDIPVTDVKSTFLFKKDLADIFTEPGAVVTTTCPKIVQRTEKLATTSADRSKHGDQTTCHDRYGKYSEVSYQKLIMTHARSPDQESAEIVLESE